MEYSTTNSQQTIAHGETLASTLRGGDILLLHGDLGAGKTTWTKGIAQGLGITDTITSPSFSLMNLYSVSSLAHPSITQLIHIDTYRLH